MTSPHTPFGSIVGLDISLIATGFACATPGDARAWTSLIESSGSDDATWDERWNRLSRLTSQITDLVPENNPLILIEGPAYSRNTGSAMDRHGLFWFVYNQLASLGYQILIIGPTVRAKYATGKGNSGKDAVIAATVRRFPNLDINNNNVADAVTLVRIGCRLTGAPIDDPLPATHLAALGKLSLPAAVDHVH